MIDMGRHSGGTNLGVGDLRSKTQGRANYSMVFDSYAEVPANVSKEIIAKATGQ